jgi:tetratricopeptide (TPR) repeat protein
MGDLNRALAEYNEAIRLDPNSAAVFADRGLVYETAGDYAHAVPDFEQATKLAPGIVDFWNSRCWARALDGKELQQALADCNEALRLGPDRADVLDSRGMVYLKLGDLKRARADYDAALHINPQFAGSLYARGFVKQRSGDGDGAGADADFAAAKAIRSTIAEEFASFGFK